MRLPRMTQVARAATKRKIFMTALRLSDDSLVDAEAEDVQDVFVVPFTSGPVMARA